MAVNPTPATSAIPPVAADLSNLQAIKSNLLQALAAETAYQALHGAKPSYTLDGKSVQWTEYRAGVLDKIHLLDELIQLEVGPFMLVSQMSC